MLNRANELAIQLNYARFSHSIALEPIHRHRFRQLFAYVDCIALGGQPLHPAGWVNFDRSAMAGGKSKTHPAEFGGTVLKKPSTLTSKVLGSGDVLLSHGLSSHDDRGGTVSLPWSEWERVARLAQL